MLTEKFYKKLSGGKLDSIQCDTRFVDDINDGLQYFIDAETGMCCDDGYTRDELSIYTDDDKLIDEIMNVACHRYGCEMVGDEMQAENPEQLLQAMMTVYAWIVFEKEME